MRPTFDEEARYIALTLAAAIALAAQLYWSSETVSHFEGALDSSRTAEIAFSALVVCTFMVVAIGAYYVFASHSRGR